MSSVTFTKEASQQDFVGKLDAMLDAVANSQRLTDKLEITSTNTPCYFFRRIGYLVADTFSTFRTHNVAASLLQYCQANKDFATQDIIVNKAKKIVEDLDKKTANRYAAQLANTLEGFELFEYPVAGSSDDEDEIKERDPINEKEDKETTLVFPEENHDHIVNLGELKEGEELAVNENKEKTADTIINTDVPLVPYEQNDDTKPKEVNTVESSEKQPDSTTNETNVENV